MLIELSKLISLFCSAVKLCQPEKELMGSSISGVLGIETSSGFTGKERLLVYRKVVLRNPLLHFDCFM